MLLLIAIIILFSTFFTITSSAGKAGVGVLNVSPVQNFIRVTQQDSFIRVYLTVSDYNSWADIFTVTITLEDYGLQIAEFMFKQYEDESSFVTIDEFSEKSGGKNLLATEKCSFDRSDLKDTVSERCNLELLFVFQTTIFNRLNIEVKDREGATASTHIDYDTGDMMRSDNIITIPGFDEPITIELPSYLLNIIIVALAIICTRIFLKKMKIGQTKRE